MPLRDFDQLLPALDGAFGEPVVWAGRAFTGRFRQDPYVVPLQPTEQGLGSTETWFYCDRRRVPGPGVPGLGDVLVLRGRAWEITEAGEDDLGELAFRLARYEGEASDPPDERRPGRPSRRDEIIAAYSALALAGAIDRNRPAAATFAAIRERLTGAAEPSPGLADKTLHKILGPLF